MDNVQNMQGVCKCPHHKVFPILIILLGLDFLLGALGVISWHVANIIWPVLVILAGLMKLGTKSGMCKCCAK